jgi:VWFA-related protein
MSLRLALLAILVAATSPVAAQQPVFRASTDLVVVDVSVRQDGRPVTGLTAADFVVTDNAIPQTLLDVSRETMPIDVDLIVDISASMEGDRYMAMVRALDAVEARLGPDDRARVITFNQQVRDAGLLTKARRTSDVLGRASGATSLYDALAAGLIMPLEPSRRRMAIVFTDGVDGSSLLEGREVLDVAARSGVTVFSVMLPDTSPSTTPIGTFIANAAGEDVLKRLSSTTGGVYTSITQNNELSTTFVRAFDEFRTSYVLRYAPAGTPKPGWHELSVRVTKNGRYDVRARKGYIGQ